MPKSITGIIRGCGMREDGGLYVCSGLSPYGLPFEDFIIDPPIPFNGDPFRSPMIIERDGKKHLMLWVGAKHYPYVSDYLEETRMYGVSRRIPINFPIDEIDAGSFMFFVHPKAMVAYYELLPPVEFCPKNDPTHKESNKICCLGHSYAIAAPNMEGNKRKLGSAEYKVYPLQHATSHRYEFKAGMFLRMPITHFDYVKKGGKIAPSLSGKNTKLPLNFEDN